MTSVLNYISSLIFGGQRAIPANCAEINEELGRLSTTNLDVVGTVVTSLVPLLGQQRARLSEESRRYLEGSVDFESVRRRYLSGSLNKPLLLWIDGFVRSQNNNTISERHSCLLVVGSDYVALFNPGVPQPRYATQIARPELAKDIIEKIQRIRTRDRVGREVWYKTVEETDITGRLHCVDEAGELAAQLTSKQALPGLGYSSLR
ncbi:hypothetical protein BDF22DRAFT_657928 [Syncephalis plumigaleata]|nr:hypothetical protein BDF22DRAFT_657928 [Syncephalis plumigaleata]